MKRKMFLFAVLVAAYPATLASADVFFDRDLFELENPGLPVLDFEGIAPKGDFIEPAHNRGRRASSFPTRAAMRAASPSPIAVSSLVRRPTRCSWTCSASRC